MRQQVLLLLGKRNNFMDGIKLKEGRTPVDELQKKL